MPEISDNASIFIATSWQALDRANRYKDDAGLRFCNSMIILIFACFYLEETLNVIKDQPENKKNLWFFL